MSTHMNVIATVTEPKLIPACDASEVVYLPGAERYLALLDYAGRHVIYNDTGPYESIIEAHVLVLNARPDKTIRDWHIVRGFVRDQGHEFAKWCKLIASWGEKLTREQGEEYLAVRGYKVASTYRE